MTSKFIFFTAAICLLILCSLLAQQKSNDLSALKKAIEAKEYKQAEVLLAKYTDELISSRNADSLLTCIPLTGEIANELYGTSKSITEVYKLVDKAKLTIPSHEFHRKLFLEAAEFFSNIGQNNQGYEAQQMAMNAAMAEPGTPTLIIAQVEYNLGVYAQRLANVNLSAYHHRKAMAMREKVKDVPDEDLYLSYNAMGSVMWYSSKYDSATYFFTKALDALAKMPENDVNRYYRPSIIQNNLAGLYGAEGKITEGIKAMQDCISNTQKFLAGPEPHPKKANALSGLFEGIDNLAGLYKDIGDYKKAGDLLRYSYQQKQQKLNAGHPGIFISEILLGQHYNDVREYDKSLGFLLSGVAKLKKAEGDYLFWQADASYAMAIAYENKKNIENARKYYAESEKLFEESYQGEYDNIYLQFLRGASAFYASHQLYEKAISMAEKGYTYIKQVQGVESLAAFYQLLNMAEVSKIAGHYNETIQYSKQGLDILSRQIRNAKNLVDTVKLQVYQPKAILLNLQAQYSLQKNRDTVFLRSLSEQLNEALEILKRRRSLIDDEESINILMAEHAELIRFSKQVELELYQQSQADIYLERFINLHESGIYHRIRSRLDKAKLVQFAGIPATVREEETRLKEAIPASLKPGPDNSSLMNNYLQASSQWNNFLERIRITYPAYYNLRYGSPFLTWKDMQSSVPAHSTIVRYFFTDSLLHVLVIDKKEKKLFTLDHKGIEERINAILRHNTNEKVQGDLLKELYDALWKPIEPAIHTENLVIIPDGSLFALSFELLTPQLASSYSSLINNSLLARHSISYHYSLYMIGNSLHPGSLSENYIAFVPGFSDESKRSYLAVAQDSVNLDYQYLSLLSQPITKNTAQNITSLLEGKAYFDDASTLASFREHAAGHKIIHIGTHAEFNNQIPERSRLVFSKNTSAGADSNYLFLDDIYTCNAQSDLTILTACESGKPGFQDGEGMISIAHAFNYAGSKSILTGLWKIDEKASNIITETFVKNLHAGVPADLALRKAKLAYLGTAEGRVLAPAYWAGLVLIGQTPVLSFTTSSYSWLWPILMGAIILIVGGIVYLIRKKYKAGITA